MNMRLSYFLGRTCRQAKLREILARIRQVTELPASQWEICIAAESPTAVEYVAREFPGTNIFHGSGYSSCSGRYILPVVPGVYPQSAGAVAGLLSHLEGDVQAGAVVGRLPEPGGSPALPTLTRAGITCFRKTALEKAGGFSALAAVAADYDLSFRILAAGLRIEHREDIIFESIREAETTGEKTDGSSSAGLGNLLELLSIPQRHLPENLAQVFRHDWLLKYHAICAQESGKVAAAALRARARIQQLRSAISAPDPVSDAVADAILGLRRHAGLIGDWARRESVWRVVLGDFSDNLWATFNACRASGLQMRCVCDNNPAFKDLTYRELPVVPASRAFEGGGIDGVILTTTDPLEMETSTKSIRNYFRGPILRLGQPPLQATHAQPIAA
jgi:hypothetical protein